MEGWLSTERSLPRCSRRSASVSRRRRRNERPKDDVVLDAAFDVMSDLIRLNDGAEVPRPRTNSGWYNAIMGGFRE